MKRPPQKMKQWPTKRVIKRCPTKAGIHCMAFRSHSASTVFSCTGWFELETSARSVAIACERRLRDGLSSLSIGWWSLSGSIRVEAFPSISALAQAHKLANIVYFSDKQEHCFLSIACDFQGAEATEDPIGESLQPHICIREDNRFFWCCCGHTLRCSAWIIKECAGLQCVHYCMSWKYHAGNQTLRSAATYTTKLEVGG